MTTQDQIATTKKVELSLTLPSINFSAIKAKAKILFFNIYRPIQNKINSESAVRSKLSGFNISNLKGKFKFEKKNIKYIFPVILGVIVVAAIVSVVRSLPDAQSRPVGDERAVTKDTLATLNLDRKFNFPLLDENGKEAGQFEYVIQSASLQEKIIVQGQRASAVEGRVFLILNLKITNSLTQTISLNTRDYLRLVVISTPDEQLAPDIHNDPVEVQAISTKYTRVGIAINKADAKKLIQLKVGEINGEKQNIDLNFKY